jgi:hypothetical protein
VHVHEQFKIYNLSYFGYGDEQKSKNLGEVLFWKVHLPSALYGLSLLVPDYYQLCALEVFYEKNTPLVILSKFLTCLVRSNATFSSIYPV